jgi:hypothetical protein
MTVMINRSLTWIVVAPGFGAFHADRAAGQIAVSAPLPAGVTACEFSALAGPAELDDAMVAACSAAAAMIDREVRR